MKLLSFPFLLSQTLLFSNFEDEARTVHIADFNFGFVTGKVFVATATLRIDVLTVNLFDIDIGTQFRQENAGV